MKLQDSLPHGVTVNGKFYPMDFDFRNVLRMLESMELKDLTEEAWVYRALKCVMRRPRGDLMRILAETRKVLFANEKEPTGEKLTDYVQDADLIRAAFQQAYGIDLWREKLHWLEFTALMSGIPEGTRYSDILSIRARPMPEPTKYNAEERANLAKAKAEYALKMTDDERENNLSFGLNNLANMLLSMAGKGGE